MHLWEYSGLVDSGHSSTTVSIKTLPQCEEKVDVNDRMKGKLSHLRSWFESCGKQCKLKLLLLPCTILLPCEVVLFKVLVVLYKRTSQLHPFLIIRGEDWECYHLGTPFYSSEQDVFKALSSRPPSIKGIISQS